MSWRKIIFLLLFIFSYPLIITGNTQSNIQGPNNLKWQENIELNTILGWKVTDFIQLGGTPFQIGKIRIDTSDVIQIGFVSDPPTSAKNFFGLNVLVYNYNPPNWINLFVNSIPIDLDLGQFELKVGRNMDFSFLQLFVLPIEYSFENGSTSSLDYFFNVFGDVIFSLQDYSYTLLNNSILVEWTNGTGINKTSYSYTISQTTGVTTRFSWNTSEFLMVWNYFEEAGNLDLEGNLGLLEDRYSIQLAYPMTTPWVVIGLVYLFFILFGLIVLKFAIDKIAKSALPETTSEISKRQSIHLSLKRPKVYFHGDLLKSNKKKQR